MSGSHPAPRSLVWSACLVAVAVLSACGDSGETAAPAATPAADPGDEGAAAVTGDVTVFAAASLTDTFTRLGEEFMAANPDATVVLSFAGSSALATQINEGGPRGRLRGREPGHHADRRGRRWCGRRADRVRHEHAADRGPAGQPGRHHRAGGPHRAGADHRAVRGRGALRGRVGGRVRGRRPDARTGHARAGRQGGAQQGRAGRGRRGPGVPHRRDRLRRRRHRDRLPGVRRGRQRLPHRRPRRRSHPRRGPGLRRPRAVGRRSAGAHRCRLRGCP